jgi:RNA polymerase sigma-70 factor, ECF subfamily
MDSEAASARFEQLFRDHYGRVLSYAHRRMPSSVADDVVAETFLIAWRRLESIPRDELPWLLGVARRVRANQRRLDVTRERVANRFAAEPLPNEVRDVALDPELGLAFSQLSEGDQELLRLIAWEGMAPAEAGRVLGWSAVRARVRLHRARARLQGLLQHPDAKEGKRWKPDPTS